MAVLFVTTYACNPCFHHFKSWRWCRLYIFIAANPIKKENVTPTKKRNYRPFKSKEKCVQAWRASGTRRTMARICELNAGPKMKNRGKFCTEKRKQFLKMKKKREEKKRTLINWWRDSGNGPPLPDGFLEASLDTAPVPLPLTPFFELITVQVTEPHVTVHTICLLFQSWIFVVDLRIRNLSATLLTTTTSADFDVTDLPVKAVPLFTSTPLRRHIHTCTSVLLDQPSYYQSHSQTIVVIYKGNHKDSRTTHPYLQLLFVVLAALRFHSTATFARTSVLSSQCWLHHEWQASWVHSS